MFVRLLLLLPLLGAAAMVQLQAAAPSHWQWSNPLPHRQNWRDLAGTSGNFVGLTEGFGGRLLFHSANGNDWDAVSLNGDYGISRVIYANGNFVAVGNRDLVLSSADGVDWQVRHQDDGGSTLIDVAYGNGKYVAVGYNAVAFVADTLTNWQPISNLGNGYSLVAVEYGNGVFLAFGGKMLRSSDGANWTELPRPDFLFFDGEIGFAFSNGKFVLSGSNGTAISEDGTNWKAGPEKYFRKIIATENGFLGLGRTTMEYSQDGSNWQKIIELPGDTGAPRLNCAVAAGGQAIAAGDAGFLFVGANDGPMEQRVGKVDFSRSLVAFANGAFIRYGDEAGHYISADGESWDFNPEGPLLTSLTGGNGVWVGLEEQNSAAVSTNGIHWQNVNLPGPAFGRILFANGLFVVASDGGVMVSNDGQDWENRPVAGARSLRLIGFQNGLFAAMTEDSAPAISTDGRNWTVHPVQSEMSAQFYAAGNGKFVGIHGAGMGPGSVTFSTDGIHWQNQRLTSGATHFYTTLEFGGGYFLMTDNYGEVHSSADGIHWTGERQAPQTFTASAYGAGTWVVVGGDSVLRSAARALAQTAVALEISQKNLSTWNLVVRGSGGQSWRIESATTMGGEWKPLKTVEIPVAGRITVPLTSNPDAMFFRAVAGIDLGSL